MLIDIAGHNSTHLINSNEKVNSIKLVDGILLGYLTDFQYGKQKITMGKGDTLFLYTDGVNEAMDKDENEFSELIKSVINEIEEFTGGIPQSDDITVLTLHCLP